MSWAKLLGYVLLSMALVLGVMLVSGAISKFFGQYAGFIAFVALLAISLYLLYILARKIVLSYIESHCVIATLPQRTRFASGFSGLAIGVR